MVLLGFPDGVPDDDTRQLIARALSKGDAVARDPRVVKLPDGASEVDIARSLVAGGVAGWAILDPDGAVPELLVSSSIRDNGTVDIGGIITDTVGAKWDGLVTYLAPPVPGIFPALLGGGGLGGAGGAQPAVPVVGRADTASSGAPAAQAAAAPAASPVPGEGSDQTGVTLAPVADVTPPEAPAGPPATTPPPQAPVTPAASDCGCVSADVVTALAQARRKPAKPITDWATPEQQADLVAAYLDEQTALNAAIAQHATPGAYLLNSVPDEAERGALAARILSAERVWASSPEIQLWESVDASERSVLATELLRVRGGLPATPELAASQAQFEAQRVAFEEQRVEYFRKVVAHTEEYIEQRKKWRELAGDVPKLLRWTLLASLALALGVLLATFFGKLDGWQAALILFVLALSAVSPAVLLLLERPLAGIDAFQPPGSEAAATAGGGENKDGDAKDDAAAAT